MVTADGMKERSSIFGLPSKVTSPPLSSSLSASKRTMGFGALAGELEVSVRGDAVNDILATAEINGDNRSELTFLALLVNAACLILFELLRQLLGDFFSHIGDLTVKKPPSKVLPLPSPPLLNGSLTSDLPGLDGVDSTSSTVTSGTWSVFAAFLLAAINAFSPELACFDLLKDLFVVLPVFLDLGTLVCLTLSAFHEFSSIATNPENFLSTSSTWMKIISQKPRKSSTVVSFSPRLNWQLSTKPENW